MGLMFETRLLGHTNLFSQGHGPFISRKVVVKNIPLQIQAGGVDPSPTDLNGILKYNAFAALGVSRIQLHSHVGYFVSFSRITKTTHSVKSYA
jgi:hypothetical protein